MKLEIGDGADFGSYKVMRTGEQTYEITLPHTERFNREQEIRSLALEVAQLETNVGLGSADYFRQYWRPADEALRDLREYAMSHPWKRQETK